MTEHEAAHYDRVRAYFNRICRERTSPVPTVFFRADGSAAHFTENEPVDHQSNPISLSLKDTFEHSSAADWSNLSYTATAKYSDDGKLSLNVQFENTGSDVYQFEQFRRGIDHIIDSLPGSGDPAFHFENMQINFDISNLHTDMPAIENLDTDFLPPDLELKVVEWPKVIIKYVGGPIYIPPSADPDYVPPEYREQIFDGKTNLDLKA